MIEDAIKNQVGKDLITLKKPHFDHNSDFKTDVFSQQFDFIIAQSIFSHTGSDIIRTALRNFKESLKPSGIIAATFIEGISDFDDSGWVYPGCVNYRPSTIEQFAQEANFFVVRIPWYHPRQTWYVLSMEKDRLPNKAMLRHLSGAVLLDHEFVESWKYNFKIIKLLKKNLKQTLPQPIKNMLRKLIANKSSNHKAA